MTRSESTQTHISIDSLGAVVLVISLARAAVQARPDLRANTDAVADVDALDIRADADGVADDLVADDERELGLAPAAGERVHVRGADTAVRDRDLDVILVEVFRLELFYFEIGLYDAEDIRKE